MQPRRHCQSSILYQVGHAPGPLRVVGRQEVIDFIFDGIARQVIVGERRQAQLGTDEGGAVVLSMIVEPVGPGQAVQVVVGLLGNGLVKGALVVHPGSSL
jgi:hypothetical protein